MDEDRPKEGEGWVIESYDISRRWGRVDGGAISVNFPKWTNFHFWGNSGNETFDEITGIAQAIEDHDLWHASSSYDYRGRPMRIRELKTGTIMPFEMFDFRPNQNKNPEQEQGDNDQTIVHKAAMLPKKPKHRWKDQRAQKLQDLNAGILKDDQFPIDKQKWADILKEQS